MFVLISDYDGLWKVLFFVFKSFLQREKNKNEINEHHGSMIKLWRGRESFKPLTKRCNCNRVINFDSHLNAALSKEKKENQN